MRSRKNFQAGQALIESLFSAFVLVGLMALFLGWAFAFSATTLIEDQIDETLLCLTQASQQECLKPWDHLTQKTALEALRPKAEFFRSGQTWVATARWEWPWGRKHSLRRELQL